MPTRLLAKRTGGSGQNVDIRATRHGDLMVNQYLPSLAMLSAAGEIFAFDMSAGTAKRSVPVMPTNSPEWSIYNANTSGGKHLILIHVGVISTSGSLGLGLGVVATVGVGHQTAQSANYSGAIVSCLDGTSKTPSAYITNNKTILGTQPAWITLDTKQSGPANVVAVGTGLVARPGGIIIAPPKNSIFVEIVGPIGGGEAALYDIVIVVAETQLDT